MWNRLTRTIAPAGELITLPAIKAHLNVEHDDDDDLVGAQLLAAIGMVDGATGIGVALLTQTWRLSLDRWPDCLRIPLGPVQAVASVTYLDANGVRQTLDPSAYLLDTGRKPAVLAPAFGTSWPDTRPQSGAILITFTAGFGDAVATVPAQILSAIKLLVGDLYANRESIVIGASRVTLVESKTAARLLDPWTIKIA
jgi:uncharacterized phiE125 gp8 family phage protein